MWLSKSLKSPVYKVSTKPQMKTTERSIIT